MYTIRGAITVDANDKHNILKAVKQLINEIIEQNSLKQEEIISFIFSTTDDLDQVYPGQAVRDIGFNKTSIMCLQEMKVKDSLNKCIRVMMLINNEKVKNDVKHIYLNKAAKLREDLNFLSEE
ncbi:MAG: chorismate mutase [Bacillota bacterium]